MACHYPPLSPKSADSYQDFSGVLPSLGRFVGALPFLGRARHGMIASTGPRPTRLARGALFALVALSALVTLGGLGT